MYRGPVRGREKLDLPVSVALVLHNNLSQYRIQGSVISFQHTVTGWSVQVRSDLIDAHLHLQEEVTAKFRSLVAERVIRHPETAE